ncbi:MAG: 30S ribosomal protein S6 [Roseibacillus sp.]
MNRKYESLIVLNTKGNEDSVDELVGAVANEMESEGAKLDEIKQLGKRKFAYNARHLDSGHYVNYIFAADPQQVQNIQNKLKLNSLVHLQHYQRVD